MKKNFCYSLFYKNLDCLPQKLTSNNYCDNKTVIMEFQKFTFRGLAIKLLRDLLMLAVLNDIFIGFI